MNIYISNFDVRLKNDDLKSLFTPYGEVQSAEIAIDGFTELSRGFGHVEMPDEEQAQTAIAALNQKSIDGRVVTVRQAEPKEDHRGSYKVGSGAVKAYRFKKQ